MRPSRIVSNLHQAFVVAERTTCVRRAVGCVVTDDRDHVLSTGRNGVPEGQGHCNEGHPCPAHDAPSGTNLSGCRAIHAEINAIARCSNPRAIHSIYVTVSPCRFCMDALLALPNAKFLYFAEKYEKHVAELDRWGQAGRTWLHEPVSLPKRYTLSMTVDAIANRIDKIAPNGSKALKIEIARDLHEAFYMFPRNE